MSAALRHARVGESLAQVDPSLPVRAVSFGESSGVSCHGSRFDPHAFRRAFPEKWRSFLRAHHRSATEVAFFYGVTDRAARDWWEGVSSPRGAPVAIAAAKFPTGFALYLVEAA